MGFTPPVPQKYTDWEIRVAVLISLAIQICLIFVAPIRRRSASRGPRFLVWSFYLLADWIADLALGLLLNNMGNIGSNNGNASLSVSNIGSRAAAGKHPAASDSSSSPIIFAFWVPFLLLHLGGPDTITAYSIEDCELWLRHLIGLLFELFAASVVFFCSLSGNPMIPTTVLMFVVGTVKYGERTYSLYCGSVDGFRDSVLGEPVAGPNYAKLMEEFQSKWDSHLPAEINIPIDVPPKKLEPIKDGSVQYVAYQFYQNFRRLFVDLILSCDERNISKKYFFPKNESEINQEKINKAFAVVEMELSYIYDVTYTKAAAIHTTEGYVARCVGSACLITSLLFFVFLNKAGFRKVDIGITYALLIGAIVLDGAALLMLLFSDWTRVFLEKCNRCQVFQTISKMLEEMTQRKRWAETMSQLNLISYCLGKPVKPDERIIHKIFYRVFQWKPLLMSFKKVAKILCCTEMLDETIYVKHVQVEDKIKSFIFKRLIEKSKEVKEGEDLKKIGEICNRRGLAAFEKLDKSMKFVDGIRREVKDYSKGDSNDDDKPEQKSLRIIRNSFDHNFDHSLLLWHIATELIYSTDLTDEEKENAHTPNTDNSPDEDTLEYWIGKGKVLSDYMLYLLVKQPAMLMTTAGIGLIRFRDTCAEARRLFDQHGLDDFDQEKACKLLLSVNTSANPADVKGDRSKSVLFDACILAKCLLDLKDKKTTMMEKDKKMMIWKLIAEVWAEMLFYVACHCRGYGHVRQLSKGGEMLTIVWLLMAHLGLGEMYQIQGGDAKAKLIAEK